MCADLICALRLTIGMPPKKNLDFTVSPKLSPAKGQT